MKYKSKLICGFLVGTILISGCSAAQDKESAQSIEIEEVTDAGDSAEGTNQNSVDNTSSKSDEDTSEDSNAGNSGTSADSAGDGDHSTVADYDYDYSEDIKADVEAVVEASSSLQEELSNIPTITDKYEDLFSDAETQFEMNVAAGWYHEIWDAELNNIWKRFTDLADEETKQRVLADQRNWIDMTEEVVVADLGPREEGGSIYPLERSTYLEEATEYRCYVIANELAKLKGEEFTMPERSTKYGTFVDNQGTGSVYGILITRPGWEKGSEEAIISAYRVGEVTGSFVDNGDGTLLFTSDDESVKGIITIDWQNGATFKVTEVTGDSIFNTDEIYEFPFVF